MRDAMGAGGARAEGWDPEGKPSGVVAILERA